MRQTQGCRAQEKAKDSGEKTKEVGGSDSGQGEKGSKGSSLSRTFKSKEGANEGIKLTKLRVYGKTREISTRKEGQKEQ